MKIISTENLPKSIVILLLVSLLSACEMFGSRYSPEYYTVRQGDTLYSIAWSVGVDYHQLAEWNGISGNYRIRPGQRLRILPPGEGSQRQPGSAATGVSYYQVRRGDTLYSIARKHRVSVSTLRRWNGLSGKAWIYPGQKLRVSATAVAKGDAPAVSRNRKSRRNTPVARASGNSEAPRRGSIRWVWPVKGKILSNYDKQSGRKGINIAGARGTPIRAAASGVIVYQGSGLRGYGRLIIVKHNNDFLSAYAHCDSFVLKESSKVGRGAVIAKLGSTGTNRNQLHFEIRFRGNPVNPIGYLPR